jgi:predicted amidohydrolase
MKVAAVQMDIAWHDRAANHDKAKRLAAQAREAGADMLVLPEMFSTGFSMDTSITPESLEGATPTLLRTLARGLDMVVVGGFVLERDNGGPQNVSLAVDRNGNDLALYAKIHQIALLGEDGSYDPGDWPVVFKLEEMNAACFVCYDLRFPELFRTVVCAFPNFSALWSTSAGSSWSSLPGRLLANPTGTYYSEPVLWRASVLWWE